MMKSMILPELRQAVHFNYRKELIEYDCKIRKIPLKDKMRRANEA